MLKVIVHGHDSKPFGKGETPDFTIRGSAEAKPPHVVRLDSVRHEESRKSLG